MKQILLIPILVLSTACASAKKETRDPAQADIGSLKKMQKYYDSCIGFTPNNLTKSKDINKFFNNSYAQFENPNCAKDFLTSVQHQTVIAAGGELVNINLNLSICPNEQSIDIFAMYFKNGKDFRVLNVGCKYRNLNY